ncbi:MAG: STAS domain-containing protein [Betaproteobacteria bacterium]|nr:STAS domain-containing protein [Betaproteobacteria bacterium]
MAFSIFSRPQAAPFPRARVVARQTPAKSPGNRVGRKLGLIDIQAKVGGPLSRFTVTRYGTATERAKAASKERPRPSIELGPTELGFSPALENAALLYANGQTAAARQVLGGALVNELDSRALAMAWHAQFDLLQRANDRAAFDELALEYVAVFERSPPPWDEARSAAARAGAPGAGCFALTQVTVKGALEIPARAARYAALRIDVASLTEFDDTGCKRLVDVLRRLRRQSYSVGWQGIEPLWRRIDQKIRAGNAQNEGIWLFALELLQWQNNQAEFEERAIDYAVTFEVSPPSWEPLARKQEQAAVETLPVQRECHVLKGVLLGPADPQISALYDFAAPRGMVQIDMAQVERFDFVCAGSLQNAVSNFDTNEKEVQIFGASPIIQALLALLGVKPEYFVRKSG